MLGRQEAGVIPHLLVAPRVQIGPQLPADVAAGSGHDTKVEAGDLDEETVDRSIYLRGIGDCRGYYEDGAYVAAPSDEDDDVDDEASGRSVYATEKAVQEAYFASLMHQYSHLRTLLNRAPPPDASGRLSASHPVHTHPASAATTKLWARTICTTDPHPLQLALMPKRSILRVLRIILGGKFLRRGYPLPERTSRWLWALLARLPERGELTHEDIGWVRDLGRRAVLLGTSLAEMAALREELAEGGLGVHEGVDAVSTDEDSMAREIGESLNCVPRANDSDCHPECSPVFEVTANDRAGSASEVEARERDIVTAEAACAQENAEEAEDGEIEDGDEEEGKAGAEDADDDGGDGVPMDTASESSGRAPHSDDDAPNPASLLGAKMRLLAQLDNGETSSSSDGGEAAHCAERERSRMNIRATINMILSVIGEFYGQRDLLEFRQPFVGMNTVLWE